MDEFYKICLQGFFAVTAVVLAYLLGRRTTKAERLRQHQRMITAFRDELESNLVWLRDNILETRLYLRDEAWRKISTEGLLSDLKPALRNKISSLYSQLHKLNHQLKIMRGEATIPPDTKEVLEQARKIRDQLIRNSRDLIPSITEHYRNIIDSGQ